MYAGCWYIISVESVNGKRVGVVDGKLKSFQLEEEADEQEEETRFG